MFSERLKIARKRAGLSLRNLAEQLGGVVSAQAIGKYEQGKMFPSSSVLVSLARTLDVSLDFLTSSQVASLGEVEFRKNISTRGVDVARIEASVINEVEKYLSIEAILDLPSDYSALSNMQKKMQCSMEDAEQAAMDLRNSWCLGTDAITSVTGLFEEKGIKVLLLEMPNNFSGLTCDVQRGGGLAPVPVIVANSQSTIERRRFTLCHELAHKLIADVAQGYDHEKVMHRFASAFLMPADRIRAELGEARHALAYQEIMRVKRMFGVSAAALIVRCRDLRILPPNVVTYMFQGQALGWKTREPDPITVNDEMAKRERPERFRQLVYRALAERLISLPKAAGMLNLPLVEIEMAIRGPVVSDAHYSQ
ncbi:MAG: helix-turn-helix domain-containing protein [Asticcacaulis sp.]